MTNIPPADDSSEIDSDLFEDWLVQAADSKGVSKQELMNQMLSSYWILDELTGLVGETEANNTRQLSAEDAASVSETVSQGNERSKADDIAPDEKPTEGEDDPTETESTADGSTETEPDEDVTEKRIREIQMAIQELVEDQSTGENRGSVDDESADSDAPSAATEIQKQCETLDSKLQDLEYRQDTQFDRLSDELQLALDRVNELEREQDRSANREDIEAIAEDIHTIDSRLEELRKADHELESRMDREFDSIEELFRRVLNAFDDLESELDAATESYQEKLEPIKEREAERKRLEELKNDALSQGVRKGSCERCDRTVDLALLESADCPNCGARFAGIDDSGWNPLRSATLETGSAPTDG